MGSLRGSCGSAPCSAAYWGLQLLVLLCCAASQSCPAAAQRRAGPTLYNYEVVGEYPHDPTAFTQGLQFDTECDKNNKNCRDIFWESTGQYGESTVRVSHVETGQVARATPMDRAYFGEGLTRYQDRLYQITWLTNQGFIYSIPDLKQVGKFQTPLRDGWGITVDDEGLMVLSDGSDTLTWVDPEDGFKRVRSLAVRDGTRRVPLLNELEYIDGEVWANIWMTECIARVCPTSGRVTGWVLMQGLLEALRKRNLPQPRAMDVLNGIAWDSSRQRLFLTGKYWPRVFEVKVVPVEGAPDAATQQKLRTCFQRMGSMG